MKRLFILLIVIYCTGNAQEQLISSVETIEQKEPCLQTITGQIRDQITNELIPNTIVSLSDKDGNPVQTMMVTENGTFTFKVECQNTYRLTASRETYNPQATTFTTTNKSGLELNTKILLDQGRIDFIVDPAEDKKSMKIASLNAENKLQTISIEKSYERMSPVEENKKDSKEPLIKEKKKVKEKSILKARPKVQTVKNSFNEDILVLKPVIFDYESSYLNREAKKDLLKVVEIMKKNPDLMIECASYTDAKGTEKYNLWMSRRRAKRTVEYIIRNGIDPQRIKGKGYGESKLINDCTDGDDCTDQQRAINRRTEFKIVKK
ncbi:MAG: OmpA family protein [Flavobacteriaceae bacterium]|nr:OmpA family protein [Flavobacteriaceae bacterium]